MNEMPVLTQLSEIEREHAVAHYRIVEPFLEGRSSLAQIAREQGLKVRTLQRWVGRFRQHGLGGLARQKRSDASKRRVDPIVERLITALALEKSRPSTAAIHRQVEEISLQYGWEAPSYSCVYDIVHQIDPALTTLAHQGAKVYRQTFDLLYRREAEHPNAIWQADHTQLNIWLLNDQGEPARPWLTAILDDFSRCVAGYFLSFKHPNALHTALALRQAIWRKDDPRWHICGIPGVFYTDHGSDFTSHHMEQICIDLKIQLVFSTVGMPRGRGRVERFFRTIDQLFLHRLPGYASEGKPLRPPALSLSQFEDQFKAFLLGTYHQRSQQGLPPPQARWETGGFLPHMPESLALLDLLLLTVSTTRRVQRDGIYFQTLRYLDPTLVAYVGEEVVIRYDPRDISEIRVYYRDVFLCRAICQLLADRTISLKEIVEARNRRRRALREGLKDHSMLIRTYLEVHQPPPVLVEPDPIEPSIPLSQLKRYYND